jgi:dihydroorotate dehydrogenase
MIELSNNGILEFIGASGLYGFDGEGYLWKFWEWPLRWTMAIDKSLLTITTKTLRYPPTKGNYRSYAPWRVIKLLSTEGKVISLPKGLLRPELVRGVANAVELTGPGFYQWLEKYYPKILRYGRKMIVSITGNEVECGRMARKLNELDNVAAIEFNASCSNIVSGLDHNQIRAIILRIIEESALPVLLKIGYDQEYVKIAQETEWLVEAISFNSIPWHWIFPIKSPLAKYGGGAVSGLVCRRFYREMLKDLLRAEVMAPIIMPVWEYEDIEWSFEAGAKAVSFGSVGFVYPARPTEHIRRWREEEKKI